MANGLTPYGQFRYPLIDSVVTQADVQNEITDFNTAYVTVASDRTAALHRSDAMLTKVTPQSVTKNTLTVISWVAADVTHDNGALGPGAAAYWSNANPTRLTAPVTGLYLVQANCAGNGWNVNTTNWQQVMVSRNGATAAPDALIAKHGPGSLGSGTQSPKTPYVYVPFSLTAGDYVEARVIWNGNPAGPLTFNVSLSIALLALT